MKLDAIIRADPAVEFLNTTVGAGGLTRPRTTPRMFIGLKPKAERDPAPVVMARLRQKTSQVPGMQTFFQSIQNLNVGGRSSKSQYQYTLQSSDIDRLYTIAPEMRNKIAQIPGLLDVTTDLYIKNPQMTVEIDREKAAVYGIGTDQIRNQLFNAFGVAADRHHLQTVERLPDHPGGAAALPAIRQPNQGAPTEPGLLRLPNAIRSYGVYLWDSVWPAGLAVFYPMQNPVPFGEVVLSAAVLVGIEL